MGADIFPAAAGGSAFVCKQSTRGQLALPTAGPVTISAPTGSWGSWVQVVSSSASEYYLCAIAAWGGSSNTGWFLRVEVGYGAAGAEQTLGEVIIAPYAETAYSTPTWWMCSGVEQFDGRLRVPISTRIAVRGTAPGAPSTQSLSAMVLATPYTSIEGN